MDITKHQFRRIIRRYVEHYNGKDSRHAIDVIHTKLSCSKQQVCGHLSWAIIGQKKIKTKTNVVGKQSDLFKI